MGRNSAAAERHEKRERKRETETKRGKNERRSAAAAAAALFRARARRGGPIAAKCREIVILQSQREFTLATGEI